jgi:hypothetical protein
MSAPLERCVVSAMTVAVLLLAGCSQTTKPAVSLETVAAKESKAPPEPVTAKTAFWAMYTPARQWAKDLVLLRLTPKDVPGYKNEAGKAAMWQATFASPGEHQYRVYSYAIAAAPPDIYKGVITRLPAPWGGGTRDTMPIDLSLFNVDSDAAYQAAATDGAAWLKKNPAKGLSSFALGDTDRFQAPVWLLLWGDKKSGYLAYVDANTGKVLKQK